MRLLARSPNLDAERAIGLLQLRVLRLGLFQDGDVGVGVFPEIEEVLVGGANLAGIAFADGRVRPAGSSREDPRDGQDVALLTYKVTEKGTFRGAALPPTPSYVSSEYIRRGGKWVNVFTQTTGAK